MPVPGEGHNTEHLLLTQHLPNFGTESEIGVETMCGEQSSTKRLLTAGSCYYDSESMISKDSFLGGLGIR